MDARHHLEREGRRGCISADATLERTRRRLRVDEEHAVFHDCYLESVERTYGSDETKNVGRERERRLDLPGSRDVHDVR
jgi:hypothetical protein